MAVSLLTPVAGAVALTTVGGTATTPAAIVADFGSFDVTETQATESVAAYGAAVYDPHRGSGTPHQKISVGAFTKGHAANTSPFGVLTAAGGTATFTIDTGFTLGGTYVVSQVRLQHARIKAAIPLTFDMDNSGDITTTWATS